MQMNSDRKRTLLGYGLVITTIGSLCVGMTFHAESQQAEIRHHLEDVRKEEIQRIQSRENTLKEIRAMLVKVNVNGQSVEVLKALQTIDELMLNIENQRQKIQEEETVENHHG
jgi:hypothetical protein